MLFSPKMTPALTAALSTLALLKLDQNLPWTTFWTTPLIHRSALE